MVSFEKSLPLEQTVDLLKYFNLIYDLTGGYISEIKSWLDQSVVYAINEDQESELENIFLSYTPLKKIAF